MENIKSPSQEHLNTLADFFKIMADTTRLKIIYTLYQSEMYVDDLSKTIKVSQSAVSHQLRILKQMRIVKSRRQGRMIYYSLDDHHIYKILKAGLEHISH